MSTTSSLRAMAWDPTRPAALFVLPQKNKNNVVDTLYASSGTGCHSYERSALIQLIQAHEKYHESSSSSSQPWNLQQLMQSYRAAITDCLVEWQENDLKNNKKNKNDEENNEEEEMIHLELLKMNYAVLHLSDIFLPLLSSSGNSSSSSSFRLRYRDPYTIPGLTTADTIRYLRYNHMPDMIDVFPHSYQEIMQAIQPEQIPEYWNVVMKLVVQGSLEEAWTILSKHSLYTTAMAVRENNNNNVSSNASTTMDRDYIRMMQEIEQNFWVIRDLFLLAPLPGGRTPLYDNDFEYTERMDDITAAIFLDDLDIQPLDYQFWEPRNQTILHSRNNMNDVPLEFEAEAAKRKHRIWQDYVKSVMQAPSFSLSRHIPEIASILTILSGDIREAPCDSWHEALVVELLYRQPDIRPKYLSSRARHIAQHFSNKENTSSSSLTDIEEALLNVMEGNAGEALHLLYVYGAGTGAALPAVLLALLCSLFVDSAILADSVSDRKIDFLCEAADAIRSSLSKTEHQDMGVQLSVRLLLPYALESKGRGERIRSLIAEILEHYAPSTERYARAMVALVRPLVEKKSIQLLDATATMLLSLYRQCMEIFDFQAAVLVLLDGVELEALVLPDRELGSCHRTLSLLCLDTAEKILSLAFETDEEKVTLLADAKVVGEAVTGSFVSRAEDVPEAKLLVRSMELVASLDKDEPDETNDLLLQILEGDVDRATGGTVLRTLHWYVLRIAQHAIDYHPTAAFDTKCIRVLMERFLQLSQYAELSKSSVFDKQIVASIETALANGLAKAFIAENARKATLLDKNKDLEREKNNSGINTSNMHNHSLDVQQRLVEQLLDF